MPKICAAVATVAVSLKCGVTQKGMLNDVNEIIGRFWLKRTLVCVDEKVGLLMFSVARTSAVPAT